MVFLQDRVDLCPAVTFFLLLDDSATPESISRSLCFQVGVYQLIQLLHTLHPSITVRQTFVFHVPMKSAQFSCHFAHLK
jgi:hypothetical protein